MTPATLPSPPETPGAPFSAQQKEYLAGFMQGIAQRRVIPFVGLIPGSSRITADPDSAGENLAAPKPEETIHGFPLSEVTQQELWKHQEHGLDCWERLLEHSQNEKFPDDENTFRFRFHGLFFVAPAQNSFMLRCRIPAGGLNSQQLRGLADISDAFGNGKAAITTRSNIQIREIAPRNLIHTLTNLQQIGLTSKGAGVDNVRNITASPTAGIDPQELLDTRPFAHALHHYILNQRDLYNLPRKLNVAFEGGGAIDTVADTNDIGFVAVRVEPPPASSVPPLTPPGHSLLDGAAVVPDPGVYFRVELCGISGHKTLARDSGLLVNPAESVAVAAAMIRVYIEHGDRTDRKKARLKYLIDRWGVEKFLAETQKKLAFPLIRFPLEHCTPRPAPVRHGHVGVYRQRQPHKNYLGVVIPVGVMTTRQMRRIADLAEHYGSANIRLTPWQNLILPDIPDAFLETVKRSLVRIGLHYESTNILGGLVACTGNTGCKWAMTDTKGQAVALGQHLNRRLQLDQPINIHLTGCPNSCAQHYVGDIGLQGVKTMLNGASVEAYNIVFGGGTGPGAAIATQVFTAIPFSEVPKLLEQALRVFLARRQNGESFAAFTRRHNAKQLQELFCP